jgi:hypothetical protein
MEHFEYGMASESERIHACRRQGKGWTSKSTPRGHALDGLILAIDLGKFNSVCCWYKSATKSAAFRHAKTTRADLGRDLTRQLLAPTLPQSD